MECANEQIGPGSVHLMVFCACGCSIAYMRDHGALMFTGWVALAPAGVMAARHKWLFARREGLWFQVCVACPAWAGHCPAVASLALPVACPQCASRIHAC